MEYKRKIDLSIRLLRNIPQDGPIEVSYSGGKDSDIILELTKMAGIPYEAIYKNTTIDPPGTIKHCMDNGVTILQPKQSFLQLIEKRGAPNRFSRFCCQVLKEYKVYDRAIQGIRKDESTKRATRYHEPEICRTYPKGGKTRIYLPILEWTLEDVARFIEERGIKLAPAYYDSEGICHYERRLGCIGCPLATEWKRREQFKQYPKLLRLWIEKTRIFMETHPNSSTVRHYPNVYDKFYGDLFFRTYREAMDFFEGRLFPFDSKEALEDYFKIKL